MDSTATIIVQWSCICILLAGFITFFLIFIVSSKTKLKLVGYAVLGVGIIQLLKPITVAVAYVFCIFFHESIRGDSIENKLWTLVNIAETIMIFATCYICKRSIKERLDFGGAIWFGVGICSGQIIFNCISQIPPLWYATKSMLRIPVTEDKFIKYSDLIEQLASQSAFQAIFNFIVTLLGLAGTLVVVILFFYGAEYHKFAYMLIVLFGSCVIYLIQGNLKGMHMDWLSSFLSLLLGLASVAFLYYLKDQRWRHKIFPQPQFFENQEFLTTKIEVEEKHGFDRNT